MKTAKFKTSSVVLDLEKSTFNHFHNKFKMYEYQLPYNYKLQNKDYAFNHTWAKTKINDPYYLNNITKKVYVLRSSNKQDTGLEYENKILNPTEFSDYTNPKLSHIWIKVLLASFLNKCGEFYSNDQFFIHSELNTTQKTASVIKINLKHDYREVKDVLFNITASATTLWEVSLSDYNQYYKRYIPYGMFLTPSGEYFKQLKLTELKDANKIYITRNINKFYNKKTNIPFHSISRKDELLNSKEYNLHQFIEEFKKYLHDFDIQAFSKNIEFNQLPYKKPKSLTKDTLTFDIVDCRRNKNISLEEIVNKNIEEGENFEFKNLEELKKDDAVLFVMDYDETTYEDLVQNEDDPYDELKQYFDEIGVISQGININENSNKNAKYENLEDFLNYDGKSLKMKFKVCVSQLNVKQKIKQKSIDFPNIEMVKDKVYIHKGYLLYINNEELCIEPIYEENLHLLIDIIKNVTQFDFTLPIINKLRDYQNPFDRSKPLNIKKLSLIFSKDGVFEITEYDEYILYDDVELKDRIESRNKVRPVNDFKLGRDSIFAKDFNAFIDVEVAEQYISYNELHKKYGKAYKRNALNNNEGFHKSIFGAGNEKTYRRELKKYGNLEIKGLKQDNLFEPYTGIWYNENEKKYYVGKRTAYKFHQSSSYKMRKIVEHTPHSFKPEEYFPLLVVDFIRHGENTVLPYPFGLINAYSQMQASIKEHKNTIEDKII
ncbi:MAG: hypothetical protein ACR2MS_09100 [Weeksellaceae bacterium]